MSEHTKEPWYLRMSDNATPYIEHGNCNLYGVGELESRVCVMPSEIMQSFNSYNNARRIVACVNACEAWTSAELEDGMPLKQIESAMTAIANKDQRIAALEESERRLREACMVLANAISGVIRVADRKTDEFDSAREALVIAAAAGIEVK